MRDIAGSDDANVAGVCAVGSRVAALGHLAATGEALVNSVTFLVAGLDTTTETTASNLMSRRRRGGQGAIASRRLAGEDMARVFAWLRPNDLVWNYWVNNYLMGHNPPAFDILYWNNDTTRLPAGLHSRLPRPVPDQRARRGHARGAGTPVDLGKVSCDSFVVAGYTDHIIPWDGAYRTTQLLGGESQFVLSNGGHIQAILNPPDNPKASYFTSDSLPATAAQWRDAATQVTGSWWTRGTSGLRRAWHHADATHASGNAAHPPLEPAPGRYVHL